MPDYGARKADKAIQRVERELRSTYGTAKRELQEKLRDFKAKYAERDKVKRQQLAEGKITRQQYADWKAGQVFQQKQWKSKVREVSSVLANTNQQAMNVVNNSRLDVFAENYNFSAFLGEQQLGVSFDVYNTQAVARLIKDDPQILPEWKIDEEKDYEWNAKKVNNIVQQGIIQGEGIPEITKRLCTDLCTQNENRMRMFARTAITGAQNAGRQQQMEDAAEMGIQVEKQWIATLDSRTRDWHRDRDGETVPYNEEFSGGLEYPGDPAGDPADVYNCRCTMITVYPEHAAHHEGGGRRAYAEYEDEDGEHRKGYVTENPNVYEGWSEKAYRRWLEKKEEQKKIAQPEPKAEGKTKPAAEKKKRTPKPFDIEAATDVEKIKKQMIKEGFVKSATFGGADLETVKQIYRTYDDMMKRFPILRGKLTGIGTARSGTNSLTDNTYANCYSMSGGYVTLNLRFFGNIPFLKSQYARDVSTGWHPMGTDYHTILYHELGHALDGALSKMSGRDFSNEFMEMIMNKSGEYDWQPYRDSDVGALVSRYATKNEKEWFAECIGTMMTADEKDKSSMQKLFEEQLNEYLRSLE